MSAGTKERVLVIEVGDEQHLVGITSHNISHLAKLEVPLNSDKPPTGENFKDKLALFMAAKMSPGEQPKQNINQGKPHA
jgi:flagellar protein FliO/FliZ